ncbi:sugar ABC transporter ATP-binding protein [Taklimakanibacter lacteus]|uniref:sugar ABC transporter ATP-binding protein n=1 Tax=Taklimakanibacter lacteus TaxID=2268456 RepID=UPI000E664C16
MASLVEMSDISKTFGGSVALKGVSLELMPGTVHALMGENGAGKSTLMKILAGVHQPDEGEIRLKGETVAFARPKDAIAAGISTVFQELSLLPNLTIAENMFLGREPTGWLRTVDYRGMNQLARRALGELGLDLDPETLVSDLTIAERQFVEIAHGIKAEANVFILDEPTAALNAADVEMLNRQIRRLRDAGKAIVYISHRMEEIFAICDTVTVLKDGELIGTRTVAEVKPGQLIAMMVGRELKDLFPPRATAFGEIVVDISDFRIDSASKPFSLSLRKGEIIALAGLEGQGQQKLLRALIGQFHPVAGTVILGGTKIALPVSAASGIRQLQAARIGFVPEDRKDEGLFLGLPISHNITMALHAGQPQLAPAKPYRREIAETLTSLQVKSAGAEALVSSLSGGNQQKVLLGRYLAADMNVLLIEEPTRGVDVGAKSEIYKLLRRFAAKGGAVIVLSRETIELIGLCDRIYVMHANTLVGEMPAAEATEHRILDAALVA